MKVSDILAHLNVRLKEIDVASTKMGEETKTGDSFLINLIELHQNALLAEFDLNIAHFSKTLNEADTVELDFEINKLICAFLNNQALNLMSYSYAIKHKLTGILYFYEKAPKIYAFSNAVSGNFELYGVKKAFLTQATDTLIISDEFTNLLVMSVFCDVMRVQVSPDNTAKLDYYYKIVNDEKSKMTALLNSRRTQTAFTAPFIRV